jgi:phosphatidylglycerol:prolipoprotein diacylglycerol transferase
MYPYAVAFGMSFYDICLVVAVVLALFMADRMGIMRGFSVKLQKVVIIALVEAIVVGFVGAVLFQAVYNAIETGKFVIDAGTGMTFYGGLIFGLIGFLAAWFGFGKVMCKSDEPVKKFGAMADIAACLVPLAHGIGRIGCFMAGCCHGAPTDAWYGVTMHTESGWMKVVPVQLYEALFLIALSGVLLWLFYKKFGKENKGRFPLLPIYAIVYGIWRFFIEYARADDRGASLVPFWSPSQLVAVLMMVAGAAYLFLWDYWKRKSKTPKAVVAKNEPANEPTNEPTNDDIQTQAE